MSLTKKLKKAGRNYIQKNVTALKIENPSKAYSFLKKMSAKPGDCEESGSFNLKKSLGCKFNP